MSAASINGGKSIALARPVFDDAMKGALWLLIFNDDFYTMHSARSVANILSPRWTTSPASRPSFPGTSEAPLSSQSDSASTEAPRNVPDSQVPPRARTSRNSQLNRDFSRFPEVNWQSLRQSPERSGPGRTTPNQEMENKSALD
jgi:hypothetical protein